MDAGLSNRRRGRACGRRPPTSNAIVVARGVRNLGLLESALATPAATFGGAFLHPTLPEMAAAYLFHLVKNHPFLDGNKRTGLAAMLAFLGLNGLDLVAEEDHLADVVLGVAAGTTSKSVVAVFIESHTVPRKSGRSR